MHYAVCLVVLLAGFCFVLGNPAPMTAQDNDPGAGDREKRMQWWRDAKFGLFIHWGPVSLKGTEIGWSRGGTRGFQTGSGQIPVDEYDSLYERFNPQYFNADQWVELARAAGMRYMVFTTKHHDGFTNWDSRFTDYKITSSKSPYGRDIVGALTDACRAAGLRLGFYYSQPDWHHPDYGTDRHDRYIRYLHNQVEELCSDFGPVDILWFDGLHGPAERWNAPVLFELIRSRQPDILINDRCGLPGDFETPEQRIGQFQNERAWETCMTIGTQWAWKPDDTIKSLKQCLHTLIRTAGGDGNLLFNVGPMPDGRIESVQAQRLREMGAWLRHNGASIYETRGGPFLPDFTAVSTYAGNSLFLHVLNWLDDSGVVVLPPIEAKILQASLLTGGSLSAQQAQDGIRLTILHEHRQEIDTIVRLDLDRPVSEITPQTLGMASMSMNHQTQASNSRGGSGAINRANNGPEAACDGNLFTSWNCEDFVRNAWWEVDLGEPRPVRRAVLFENGASVQRYALQYRQGEGWETCYTGSGIGERASIDFPAIQAQHVRVHILESTAAPSIREILLF